MSYSTSKIFTILGLWLTLDMFGSLIWNPWGESTRAVISVGFFISGGFVAAHFWIAVEERMKR